MAPSRPPRPPPRPTRDPKELFKKRGADLIRKVSDKDRYAIFLEPVDVTQVEGYADLIERPMDLSTAQKNLQMGVYRTPMELRADLDLIWSNCCMFNADDSIYYKEAVRLRALAARYYDDFVRVLSRDGVASALGLTTSRQNGPSSSRLIGKRPPRHRQGSIQSGPALSSSLHTSEPTSPEGEAEASASASASGSASAGQMPTFREAQIRRARTASDAAAIAASAAKEEALNAAIAAGIPPKTSGDNHQIFAGPKGVLRRREEQSESAALPTFQVLNHREARDRCGEVPLAWRRIGRWHTRGATATRFNSKERALDVRYGRVFQRHVRKSAPAARRLLATILDADVVLQHDSAVAARLSDKGQRNGLRTRNDVNGKMSYPAGKNPERKDAAARKPVQNGKCHSALPNGSYEPMEVDCDAGGKLPVNSVITEAGQKRPRVKCVPDDVHNGTLDIKDLDEEQAQTARPSSEFVTQLRHNADDSFLGQQELQSKRAISELQLLLKENNIDPAFLGTLVSHLPGTNELNLAGSKQESKEKLASKANDTDNLLSANHSAMLNVLRLRALREGADEAEWEDLEDEEREYAEVLTKGMSLAVAKLPPRFLLHPLDAAESAAALCQSIQARPEPEKK